MRLSPALSLTPNGISMYLGGTDRVRTSYLPLVRTDSGYATIIHLSNGGSGPVTATVTLYDTAGNVALVSTSSLGGFALSDIDVAQQLGTSFVGSAVVSTTSGNVVATADVYTGDATYTDNFDTYTAIPAPPSPVPSPQFAVWTAKGFFSYTSFIDLQNTSDSPANNVTLTFLTTGNPVTANVVVPAHGTTRFDVGQFASLAANDVSVAEVQADQPLVAVSEHYGHGQLAISPETRVWSSSALYVPRFDANVQGGWNTAVVLLNTGNATDIESTTFYNPDGSTAATAQATLQPGASFVLNPIYGSSLNLPKGFAGPAIVHSANGTLAAINMEFYFANFSLYALASYPSPPAPQTGSWLEFPGLRTSWNSETTNLTFMNTEAVTRTYQVQIYDQSGNPVETRSISVAPNGSGYLSQANDANLAAGGIYSAQLTAPAGAALPVAVVGLYGTYQLPSGAAPTPTPVPPTPSPTPGSPTATPTPTIVVILPDSYEPDSSPAQAKSLTLDGAGQSRTLYQLGDQDWVSFAGTAGENVTISTAGTCDTQLYLYDTDQTTALAFDDDGGPGFNASLQYQLTKAGTFYLRVRHYVTRPTNATWPTTGGVCAYQLVGTSDTVPLATPTQTPTQTATVTPTSTPTIATRPGSLPYPNGVGNYAGGTDRGTSFSLPLLRTDAGYDTIVHVANATGAPAPVTLALYYPDGSLKASLAQNLGAWASWDVDLGADARVGVGFSGAGALAAAAGGVSVAVDVLNGNAALDNLDSYAGVRQATTRGYLQMVTNQFASFGSTLYLQNTADAPASVTLNFYSGGAPVPGVTPPVYTLAPRGSMQLDVSKVFGLPVNYFQPVLVQSTQPVAAISELTGNGLEAVQTMASPQSGPAQFFIPRYVNNAAGSLGWAGGIAVLNAAGAPQNFEVDFYDASGNLAGVSTSQSMPGLGNGVGPNVTWLLGLVSPLGHAPPSTLVQGQVYSAVVKTTDSAAVMVVNGMLNGPTSVSTLAGYAVDAGAPAGAWADLPAVRKFVCLSESTVFSVLNPQATAQTYTIAYWSQDGTTIVKFDTVTLQPNQAVTYTPSGDAGLPEGYSGSVQVGPQTPGAPPPVLVAEVDGGSAYGQHGPPACAAPPTATPGDPRKHTIIYLPLVPDGRTLSR